MELTGNPAGLLFVVQQSYLQDCIFWRWGIDGRATEPIYVCLGLPGAVFYREVVLLQRGRPAVEKSGSRLHRLVAFYDGVGKEESWSSVSFGLMLEDGTIYRVYPGTGVAQTALDCCWRFPRPLEGGPHMECGKLQRLLAVLPYVYRDVKQCSTWRGMCRVCFVSLSDQRHGNSFLQRSVIY